jgi:glycosyltransferase involved in cell wall biosynthesis
MVQCGKLRSSRSIWSGVSEILPLHLFAAESMNTHVAFDLSRLLSRADRPVPTGIDRVELAYAKYLIRNAGDRVSFVAVAFGRFGPLSDRGARAFIGALDEAWSSTNPAPAARKSAKALGARLRLYLVSRGEASVHSRLARFAGNVVYLSVSHQNLDRPGIIERLKARSGARIICFVHDLIPIQYPEYAKPGQGDCHRRRIDSVVRLADAVIVNSECTHGALRAHDHPEKREFPIVVAPLGVDLAAALHPLPQEPRRHPYFICIGTIEPKKNHLMLLKVWRRLAAQLGDQAPRLILVGQRGWENENVLDMMERSPGIRALVEEHNALPDPVMAGLLAGARALLLPSFAEGYGLPVAEALALRVPVLCSDLPALRSVGKEVAEYLDPLDGPGWFGAVLDYAKPDSASRAAQLARLSAWAPPSWDNHFLAVQALIDGERGQPYREPFRRRPTQTPSPAQLAAAE